MNKLILLVIFLSGSFAMLSQHALDTIQVSTLNVPLTIRETGRNITVITSKDIEALPATSIDEILQSVAGVEVQSRGGFGTQGDISMRGSTFTQVLILVDGMKVNDPLTGHFNSYIPVTPAEIERIEVLRGTASAMYGPDAVGGVVNVITKTFSKSKEGSSMRGAMKYGDHKLVSGHQGFSINKGAATFGGGYSMNQSDGEYFMAREIDSTTSLDAYHNFFDIKTIGTSFAYQFKNNVSLRARVAYDSRDFGARYFYTNSAFDKSVETVNNWWNHIQVIKTGQASTTDLNLTYKHNTDVFAFSPDFPSTNKHKSQVFAATINHLYSVNNDVLLKFGGQIDQRQIESNDRGDHKDLHVGAYAMGVYQKNKLNLSFSLRGDYDANYDFELSPQLNASLVFSSLVLRGSIGRSIRAADYTERYVSNNLQNLTPGRSLGNPELAAENGWSEEIGVDYAVSNNWKLKTTFFSRQSKNLIDYVRTNQSEIGSVSKIGSLQENADYFFAKNITDVNTMGFEAESNVIYHFSPNGKLRWNLGYTYLSTSNDDDVISVYISSHAKHLLTSQVLVTFNHLDIGLTGLYKQRTAQIASTINRSLSKDYFVSHANLGFKITKNFGLTLQLQNVFDQDYQNILGASMPRRWFMGGVKWSL